MSEPIRRRGYVGPRAVPPVGDRFAEAAEHVEVGAAAVGQLGGRRRDPRRATNRFIDRERLHHIDYEGR